MRPSNIRTAVCVENAVCFREAVRYLHCSSHKLTGPYFGRLSERSSISDPEFEPLSLRPISWPRLFELLDWFCLCCSSNCHCQIDSVSVVVVIIVVFHGYHFGCSYCCFSWLPFRVFLLLFFMATISGVLIVVFHGYHFGCSAVVQACTCDSGKASIVWGHYFIWPFATASSSLQPVR
jgi:hypothetical protein